MGAVISATGICLNGSEHSLIDLASMAGEECIARAGVRKDCVDLIISTGVYRDHNIIEPAMAPLIQQKMGINLLYSKDSRTFAFDILNGACGMLSAIQAAGGMLANGQIKKALIVSCDVHPSRSKPDDFPYSSIGTAMLLEWSDDPAKGFQSIDFKTSPSEYVGTKGVVDIKRLGIEAKTSITVQIEPDFAERLYSFTIETAQSLLVMYGHRHSIDISTVKLIPTHLWKGFGREVARMLGLRDLYEECLYEKYGNPNSSALTVAYHELLANGAISPGDRLVFLAASSGLNVGTGLYFA